MLNKISQLQKFKYSFIALCSLSLAIIVNLLLVLNLKIIALLSVVCIVFLIIYRHFFENYNLIAVFSVFFIAGLASSAMYNTNFRVYPLPSYINDEKAWVTGEISEIKSNGKYAKVYLKSPEIYSDLADNLDVQNMIVSTFSSRLLEAKIGDELTAKVILKIPNEKLFADDFDYAEYLLQHKINLTAQVRGALYITAPEFGYSLLNKIANYRLKVADKILTSTKNQEVNGLIAALITGMRGGVSYEIKDDFKKSGLAHLMAISGMHMAFLAGIVFLLIRYAVCLIPVVSLNYDSKKIAGFITVLCALFYLLLAGASLPTLRAFIMITLFTITMLLNRSKVALHTLCVVAILILLTDPMAIFSASFQLSFSAVFAMLLYNQLKQDELILNYSKFAKFIRSFSNTLNISILAFTATMFVVSVHFGFLSVFSIIANVFASLLMALLVMPSLFAYFIGYILLDISLFAQLSEYSLTLLLNLANYFANFENSSVYISNNYAFVLLAVALIIISLIVFDISRKYLISLAIFLIAFIIPIKFDLRPSVIELNNGSLALLKNNDVIILGDLDKRFLRKVQSYYRVNKVENNLAKTCDTTGCIYNFENKQILHLNEGFAITNEDINLVDYVVKN